MVALQLLEAADVLRPTDWVRPLAAAPGDFSTSNPVINSFSTYGGSPQNHFKWIRAQDVVGECWMGRSLADLAKAWEATGGFAYEVVRGAMPPQHIWDWRAAKKKSGRD